MNSLQRLRLRRLIFEIAADTIAAYGISGGLSPIGDKSGSTNSTQEADTLDELDEEDLLSFTKNIEI
jgi:hypothetical protein